MYKDDKFSYELRRIHGIYKNLQRSISKAWIQSFFINRTFWLIVSWSQTVPIMHNTVGLYEHAQSLELK